MASGIKYTTKEVKDILYKLGYKLLDDEYKNARTNITIIDINGYKYYVRLGNLLSNKEPKLVSKLNPYSIYNIHKYIDNNNFNVKLLSKEYIDDNDKLHFQCSCGSTYYCTYSKFKHRTKILCNDCSLKEKSNKRKHTLEFVKNEFIKFGFIPLFDKYNHCEEKLLCKDNEGFVGEIAYNNLISGYKFQIFSINNSYTIQNINTYIKNNNLTCKLISKQWISSLDLLTFQCGCGEKFESTWADFSSQNKTRCSKCSKSKSTYALIFENWADNNNIKYHREYRIDECKYKSTLPFDYAISIDSKLILCEVDGQHHYQPIMSWGGEKGYNEQVIKDNIKNQYCKDNNIPLIRIPYWDFENGNYEQILNIKLLGNN